MLALSLQVNRRLPPEGPVAIHFDLRGQAERFGNRWLVLLAMPIGYVLTSCVSIGAALTAGPGPLWQGLAIQGGLGAVLFAVHLVIMRLLLRWLRGAGSPSGRN